MTKILFIICATFLLIVCLAQLQIVGKVNYENIDEKSFKNKH